MLYIPYFIHIDKNVSGKNLDLQTYECCRSLGPLRDFFGTLPTLPTIETFDSWGTDYYSDNWEHKFMTFFVSWQLRATLDSIRNSCDVLFITTN